MVKVTLKDIAKTLNLSHTAVSMALNGRSGVSEKTRKLVQDTAKKMNYSPNLAARSLINNKTNTLGLIISTLADPFNPKLAQGVENQANELGYNIILNQTNGSIQKEKQCIDTLLSRGVDGIICATLTVDDPNLDILIENQVPFIAINRIPLDHTDFKKIDHVIIDNFQGSYKAVNHLIKLGHKRIAMIAGKKKISTTRERSRGFRQALKDAEITADPKLINYCNYDRNCATEMTRKLLETDVPPTAFFTHDDSMALGVREAVISMGLKIPEDIALVGFDDIDISALTGIELTTISQKKYDMGLMATSILIQKIEHCLPSMVNKVILDAELMIRRSCGYKITGYRR